MSSVVHTYASAAGGTAVYLPFSLDEVVRDWSNLRATMSRQKPDSYTRDEWAYLISFLSPLNLTRPFAQSFGTRGVVTPREITRVVRHRGTVSIWLPGNVSLLGPLTMILLSLTGSPLRLKGTADTQDLVGTFLDFARTYLPEGALRAYLTTNVQHAVFNRHDSRNREMAAEAEVRIAFGSDEAVGAILSLDHAIGSVGIAFADRASEAWIEKAAVTDAVLSDLIRVFAIYGQAGCTSPRRAVLLGASSGDALEIRDRVLTLWPQIIRGEPAPHIASQNILARQCAAALGWNAVVVPQNAAVLTAGSMQLKTFPGQMLLNFVPASLDEAIISLPDAIQTVGYAVAGSNLDEDWLALLGRTRIDRFVPISRMHHFGAVWDGQAFWLQAFEEVEVLQ